MREQSELECLFSLAYGRVATAQRLMPGLATVASALNANDQALARIAAVHLRIPDVPDRAARDAMEVADILIKYARDEGGGADLDLRLHPREYFRFNWTLGMTKFQWLQTQPYEVQREEGLKILRELNILK